VKWRIALVLSVLVLAATAVVGWGVYRTLTLPGPTPKGRVVVDHSDAGVAYGATSSSSVLFEVEEGEPLGRVARRLDAQGLLPQGLLFSPRIWVLYAQLKGLDREIKAGQYELASNLSPVEILEKLCAGQVKTYPVTIPEGLYIEATAERLEQAGITQAAAFVELARSPEFARELGISGEDLEGYLFPETYRFRAETAPEDVARRMVEEFEASLTAEDRAAIEASPLSLHEVVTLASIVEKETGVAAERPQIAAVFLNRLEKRMRLQTDPTVIYGILRTRGSFDGNLRRADLKDDTPYNTYTRGGLPPGPIASVGIDSIRAVLAPADVDYLYFVSRNDGTHYFSSTLREHNNAVIRFQKGGRSE